MSTVDPDRIASILVDAFALGDGPAARKWHLSRRTVERYRARMREDKGLSALVSQRKDDAQDELSTIRVRFLRKAIGILEGKIANPEATVHEIAGAVKIVGELHLSAEVLDYERSDSQSTGPEEDTADDQVVQASAAH